MDEPPARVIARIGRIVESTAHDLVEEHEHRCHRIPPPDPSPISAIPFPDVVLSDDLVAHAIEQLEDADEASVATCIGVPLPALQRVLADYQRRYTRFLLARATRG